MENKTPYGKITLEQIREAVEYCFRDQPIEEAKRGFGDFIDVYEDKDQLSFSIKSIEKDSKGRHMNIRTGIGGFINTYNLSPWMMQMLPVRLNGQVLEGELVETFWKEFLKIKQDYEER